MEVHWCYTAGSTNGYRNRIPLQSEKYQKARKVDNGGHPRIPTCQTAIHLQFISGP